MCRERSSCFYVSWGYRMVDINVIMMLVWTTSCLFVWIKCAIGRSNLCAVPRVQKLLIIRNIICSIKLRYNWNRQSCSGLHLLLPTLPASFAALAHSQSRHGACVELTIFPQKTYHFTHMACKEGVTCNVLCIRIINGYRSIIIQQWRQKRPLLSTIVGDGIYASPVGP